MAKAAVKPPAPRKVPAKQPPGTAPAARRPRITPLTPLRNETAGKLSKLADRLKTDGPDITAHQHVRDAARMLRAGQHEAAERHLRAALFTLTPQSLMRNGLHTDDDHMAARTMMHDVHRHLLLVKDISDVDAKNQAAIHRASYGDDTATPQMPQPPARDPNNGYGPGALAQKPSTRQPGGDKAMNAPVQITIGKPDPAVADPVGPQRRGSKQFTYDWDDVARTAELSAETSRLAVTPAPYGKPGGPGLYGVKGNKHSDYFEQVVKALMEKRGMDKARASKIAWASLRKWSAKSKHVEVRAAAAGGLAEEKAAEARAHAHAVTWKDVGCTVELAAAPARVPPGQAGAGEFGSGGGAPAAGPTPAQKQQQKQQLLAQAAQYRQQADALIKQRDALRASLASASGKTSSGQAGSKTTSQSGSTTSSGASTTPSTAGSSTSTASSASTASASTAKSAASTAAPGTAAAAAKTAQVNQQIAALNTQITTLQGQYRQAMAQAAAL